MGTRIRDYWIQHAIDIIKSDYQDTVSVEDKNKDLLKFGRNKFVQTTKTTLMTLPTGTFNEIYVSNNLITTISSDNVGDTEEIIIKGHTKNEGVFTFSEQTVTLDGQNQVTLSTPLARCSSAKNNGSTDLVGTIYIYEDDTDTLGVPDTNSKVHLMIEAGLNNSEKAATTISNDEYWIVTTFHGDCLEKTTAFGVLHLEIREKDKTFFDKVDISAHTSSRGSHKFLPYLIIPKNTDVRVRAAANANDKDFSSSIEGVLLKII